MNTDRRLLGVAVMLDTDTRGGIERYAADLLSASASEVEWRAVRVGRYDEVGRRGQLRAAALAMLQRFGRPPDVVFADRLHVLPVALAVRYAAWPSRPTLTVGVYGSELLSGSQHRKKVWAAGRADALIACSQWSADTAREHLGLNRPIAVVRPGIDPQHWARPTDLDRGALRRRHGLDPAAVQLVTVARLEPNARHKGIDRTIAAVARLRSTGIDATYVIVGAGSDEGWVDERVRAAGLGDAVHRLGSASDRTLLEVLWTSDAFVLPTVPLKGPGGAVAAEGFGIALLEAAAAGVPVITTGLAGADEAFAPGVTGIRVNGSPQSIADAVTDLLNRSVVIEPGKATAWAARFAWAHRTQEVLRALTGEGAARGPECDAAT